jgi:fibronectin-binding autotransporter adhesin
MNHQIAPTLTTKATKNASAERGRNTFSRINILVLSFVLGIAGVFSGRATTVTMNANDAAGTSSFAAAGHWNNAAAPAAGNNYFTSTFQIRSSTAAGTYTFAGDSLSIDTSGILQGKAGNGATITLNFTNGTGLFLNGGSLYQAGSNTDVGTVLAIGGTITANAGTTTFLGALGSTAVQNSGDFETLNITGALGGTGNIIVGGAQNAGTNTGLVELSDANTLSGTITVEPATVGSYIASVTQRLLELNNVNALQDATLALSASNGVSFASAANTGAFNIGALMGGSNQFLADTAGNAVALNVGGNGATTLYSGTLSGIGSLTKLGAGTFTLSRIDIYTGATSVDAGTLDVSGTLNGTASITASNGEVELASPDAVSNTARFTLSAGTLQTLAGQSQSLADLTVASGSSTLTLGATASILNFSNSSADTWSGMLTIADWNGASLGGGSDEVFFGGDATGLTGGQLADISFLNPTIDGVAQVGTFGASILPSGEIVTTAGAVPEPGTWAMITAGAAMLLVMRHRKA